MYEKNYNWKVSYTVLLPTSAHKLWSLISSPNNLEYFHPFCYKNIITKWPGLNSIDQVHYHNGHLYKRNFVKWINNIGYDLLISNEKSPKSFVKWRIKDLDSQCKLTITIYPYIYNMNSKWLNAVPFFFIVKPSLYNYLQNIGKGLIYHIETNNKVAKNQFGNHNWFS
ncbi:MAG: hypothetical protein CMP49_00245 [Flavobacteriales bacterium]|jgi:hypothetical protein|nr:hypothetical protein [Flavobacteriales bacterium]|tara:strand:+ start:1929 stop:2432 length:504 start_codon:yes stop_codon:yes gene_type:complete